MPLSNERGESVFRVENADAFESDLERHGMTIEIGPIQIVPNPSELGVDDEPLYAGTTGTVRKLWKEAGVEHALVAPEGPRKEQVHQSFSWVSPTILVTIEQLATNPEMVSLAIGVIWEHIRQAFRGITGEKQAELDIMLRRSKTRYKRLRYSGPEIDVDEVIRRLGEASSE